jgi:hypothetical protein
MKTIFDSKNLRSLSLAVLAVIVLTLSLSSCSKNNDSGGSSMSAYVQVTNSADGSTAQDFYVDNTKLTTSAVAYGSSSDFLTASTGNHQGKFETSGTSTVNASVSLSPQAGKYYSVFYVDGNSTTSYQADRTAPQSGKARIRFINLSSALSTAVDFGITTGAKVASNLAYKAASTYYDVDPATAFSLYATGSSTVIISVPATLQAGHVYTIYVSGATTAAVTSHVVTEE